MGLFGGGKSSSSSTSTQTDRRQVFGDDAYSVGDGATVVGSGGVKTGDRSTVNLTTTSDGAFDVVDSVIGAALSANQAVAKQMAENQANAQTAVANAYADAKGTGSMPVLIAALCVVAAVVYFSTKKGSA